jgi:hypothetical protein
MLWRPRTRACLHHLIDPADHQRTATGNTPATRRQCLPEEPRSYAGTGNSPLVGSGGLIKNPTVRCISSCLVIYILEGVQEEGNDYRVYIDTD